MILLKAIFSVFPFFHHNSHHNSHPHHIDIDNKTASKCRKVISVHFCYNLSSHNEKLNKRTIWIVIQLIFSLFSDCMFLFIPISFIPFIVKIKILIKSYSQKLFLSFFLSFVLFLLFYLRHKYKFDYHCEYERHLCLWWDEIVNSVNISNPDIKVYYDRSIE